MKKRHIGILAVGHMATDINQGALPAMLPFFIAAYDLSYTAAASIVFAVNMSSSVIQPLFGIAADRYAKPWLLPGGLMCAGLGMGLTGFSGGYQWIMLLGIMSGIGIAAYHPEAARLVNFAAGDRKSTAMSVFGVGGTIGFTIGPLIISAAMVRWGLDGTLVLIVPVSIMSIVVISHFPLFEALEAINNNRKKVSTNEASRENWNAFARIAVIVSGRSVIFFGLNIFIPIYWINVLGQSKMAGAIALSIFAGSGIVGNIAGGNLADRIGQKKVTLLGFASLSVLLPILIAVSSVPLATILLIPTGFMLFATYSPTIVLGQKYLPTRVGLSSGVTLGLAVAIGGGAAPFIGKLADVYGVWMALASVSFLPLLMFLLSLTLPDPPSARIGAVSTRKD
ncbi:MAG: MFS transporter [Desulfofustis sp.]|jgi:MFS transporter, FSR family, fosmidomycin resistance protein